MEKTHDCTSCTGCNGGCPGCGGCDHSLTMTQPEIDFLRRLAQTPFLPVGRELGEETGLEAGQLIYLGHLVSLLSFQIGGVLIWVSLAQVGIL